RFKDRQQKMAGTFPAIFCSSISHQAALAVCLRGLRRNLRGFAPSGARSPEGRGALAFSGQCRLVLPPRFAALAGLACPSAAPGCLPLRPLALPAEASAPASPPRLGPRLPLALRWP